MDDIIYLLSAHTYTESYKLHYFSPAVFSHIPYVLYSI